LGSGATATVRVTVEEFNVTGIGRGARLTRQREARRKQRGWGGAEG